MEDPQYLQASLANSIGDQVGPVRQYPFSSAGQSTFATGCRKAGKVIDADQNGLDEVRCGFWIFNRYVSGFVIQIF